MTMVNNMIYNMIFLQYNLFVYAILNMKVFQPPTTMRVRIR